MSESTLATKSYLHSLKAIFLLFDKPKLDLLFITLMPLNFFKISAVESVEASFTTIISSKTLDWINNDFIQSSIVFSPLYTGT